MSHQHLAKKATLKEVYKPGMAHTCGNPSIWEAKARGSLVQGQPELHF
jgi:hypothetical protein